MQRVFNIDKWTLVEEGQSLGFLNDKPRNVRLEVNSPSEVELWYACQVSGEVHFLALVKGRDVVSFGSTGPFEITVKNGFVMIATNDGDDVSMKPTAEKAFVKVMERRARDPHLERMMQLMEVNMRRNQEQQAYELERLFARRVAALEAAASQGVGAGNVGDAGAEPAPQGTAGTAAKGDNSNGNDAGHDQSASAAGGA
ncbi:hypothetical protein [Tortoise microvirus 82]|nr:hypothetical protein [Tortoise microvirus 82]